MQRHTLPLFILVLMTALFSWSGPTRTKPPGVPVLLVHGQGLGPEATWAVLVSRLERRGYQAGRDLFTVDLTGTQGQEQPQGLLLDAGIVADEIRAILQRTGARQIDLVGHSRGGLIVRLLTTGDTAPLVRRAVTMNAPHEGLLAYPELQGVMKEARIPEEIRSAVFPPYDLLPQSTVLETMRARELRLPSGAPGRLALGATWRTGVPEILTGHDGIVPLESQLAWPGAKTAVAEVGATQGELKVTGSGRLALLWLIWRSPHMQTLQSNRMLNQVVTFLTAPPAPAITSASADSSVAPDPETPVTRAEFTYRLATELGLHERLRPSAYLDLLGHWSLGYVEAARESGLLPEDSSRRFEPDRPITRAEAAAMVARLTGQTEWQVGNADRTLTPAEARAIIAYAAP